MSTLIYVILTATISNIFANSTTSTTDIFSDSTTAITTYNFTNSTTDFNSTESNSAVISQPEPLPFNVSGNPVIFAVVYAFALLVIIAVFVAPVVICILSACSRD